MDAGVPWHYLRPNEASRYPGRIVCFDSEAVIDERAHGERHRFRLAAASFDRLAPVTREVEKSEVQAFTDPRDLWEWIGGKAVKSGRTVCFAHNLAYDLRLTRAFECLPALGFRLEFLTIDAQRSVCKWRRDGRALVLTDTTSYLPLSLERVALALGLHKPPLPTQDAPETEWAARCLADVEITRAAVLELLRYLRTNELGTFRLTGAAQAMAAYRHRFMPRRGLLVHREEDVLAAERRAAWSGRCEVWRHGKIPGRVSEWDFELCYLRLAHELDLPFRYRGAMSRLSVPQLRQYARRYSVLLECEVSSQRPTLPTSLEGRTVWPVGTFATTVWDLEALAAVERGAELEITRAYLYQRAPVLREWATWLLSELQAPDEVPGPLVRVMLKHWARALIGRFALRYPQWDKVATLPTVDIELVPYVDADSGETGAYLQAGEDWFERSALVEAPDSIPALMSYVMAAARVRLLEALELAGEQHVLYCDTDALLVDERGDRRLAHAGAFLEATGLRRKERYQGANLRAPRQIVLGEHLRAAGISKRAQHVAGDRYAVEVWEGLAESLKAGRPHEVQVRRRTFTLRARDRRRRHLPQGATAPFELRDGEPLPKVKR